jgi:hypothetical protein
MEALVVAMFGFISILHKCGEQEVKEQEVKNRTGSRRKEVATCTESDVW